MEIIFLILPISLGLALLAVAGFLWASRHRQFDDLDTPAQRMLLDDDPVPTSQNAIPIEKPPPSPPNSPKSA